MLETVQELAAGVAARLRLVRLDADLTQAGLAARSGVTLASLRRFETTGQIALESLIRLAQALGRDVDIATLFAPPPVASLDNWSSPAICVGGVAARDGIARRSARHLRAD